jgi:hypothetical protein
MASMTTASTPLPPAIRSAPARDQRGMGMMGFLTTAIPVIWLGLGGVELAHWMQLRQALSLILLDTARVGATRQAEPAAMARAFEQGLHRLHPAPGEVNRVLARRHQDLGLPWHIAIQLPGRKAFADHADPTLQGPASGANGGRQALIRNDHQAAQHARRRAQGWPQGRGPLSGLTIHEANTLRISLRWPHKPLFPGAAVLIRTLAPLVRDPGNRRWMAAGYLPFRRTVAIAMQSHPADWPDLPDGRVTHEAQPPQNPAPSHPGADMPGHNPAGPPAPGGGPAGGENGSGNPPPNVFDEQSGSGPDGGGSAPGADSDAGTPTNEALCGP